MRKSCGFEFLGKNARSSTSGMIINAVVTAMTIMVFLRNPDPGFPDRSAAVTQHPRAQAVYGPAETSLHVLSAFTRGRQARVDSARAGRRSNRQRSMHQLLGRE